MSADNPEEEINETSKKKDKKSEVDNSDSIPNSDKSNFILDFEKKWGKEKKKETNIPSANELLSALKNKNFSFLEGESTDNKNEDHPQIEETTSPENIDEIKNNSIEQLEEFEQNIQDEIEADKEITDKSEISEYDEYISENNVDNNNEDFKEPELNMICPIPVEQTPIEPTNNPETDDESSINEELPIEEIQENIEIHQPHNESIQPYIDTKSELNIQSEIDVDITPDLDQDSSEINEPRASSQKEENVPVIIPKETYGQSVTPRSKPKPKRKKRKIPRVIHRPDKITNGLKSNNIKSNEEGIKPEQQTPKIEPDEPPFSQGESNYEPSQYNEPKTPTERVSRFLFKSKKFK